MLLLQCCCLFHVASCFVVAVAVVSVASLIVGSMLVQLLYCRCCYCCILLHCCNCCICICAGEPVDRMFTLTSATWMPLTGHAHLPRPIPPKEPHQQQDRPLQCQNQLPQELNQQERCSRSDQLLQRRQPTLDQRSRRRRRC